MEQIGERLIWYYIPFTDVQIPLGGLNIVTVLNSAGIMIALFLFSYIAVRRLEMKPGRLQYMMEYYCTAFDGLVSNSLELGSKHANRTFFPLIGALFLFILLADVVGFIPSQYVTEPAADINCTLAFGLMGMVIATFSGMKAKGPGGYVVELMGPMFSQPDAKGAAAIAGKLSALFFFPLNVIGELAKIISISFRLFGNILGGNIIIVVVNHLMWQFTWMAMGLDLFFIFFIGAVQAFVFAMLTLTYIAVAIK